MVREKVLLAAEAITGQGKSIGFTANSPLATVTTNPDGSIVAPHVINKLAATVGKGAEFIKGDLLPAVRECAENIIKEIEERGLEKPVTTKPVEYFYDHSYLTELERRGFIIPIDKDIQFAAIPNAMEFTEFKMEEFKAGFNGGQLELEAKKLLGDESEKERIFEMYFRDSAVATQNFVKYRTSLNTMSDVIELLKVYAFASSLHANEFSGKVRYTGDFKVAMLHYMELISLYLRQHITLKGRAEKEGILGVSKDNKLSIFREAGDTFVKEFGIEPLLGASIDYSGLLTTGNLRGRENELKERFASYLTDENIKRKVKNTSLYRGLYNKHLGAMYREASGKLGTFKINEEQCITAMAEYTFSLDTVMLQNVIKIVEYVYCNIFYKHTNAKEFIGYMNAYLEADENLTQEKAAVLATLEIVTDYLLLGVEENK